MRGSFIRIENALTIAASWRSGIAPGSARDEGMGSNPCAVQKKKKKDTRETPGSHDLGVARPP